jgi:hypothetical protein
MGHTSLLEALAAALSFWLSSTLLLISSLGSAVLAGLLEVCELSDTELSDGERKLALRRCWACGWGERAGDKFLPLPNTRPPPRDRREAMSRMLKGCTALVFVQAWWYATRLLALVNVVAAEQGYLHRAARPHA